MAVRSAQAEWQGNLARGTGTVKTESGALDGAYSFGSRFESAGGTNPEELIAAAHAGCFAMALSHALAQAGFNPVSVKATSAVHLEKGESGMSITRVHLTCQAEVPGIDDATFQEHAAGARRNCIVSRALGAVEIGHEAVLAAPAV
jgi:lipoyl-dependent peroxiredoxin